MHAGYNLSVKVKTSWVLRWFQMKVFWPSSSFSWTKDAPYRPFPLIHREENSRGKRNTLESWARPVHLLLSLLSLDHAPPSFLSSLSSREAASVKIVWRRDYRAEISFPSRRVVSTAPPFGSTEMPVELNFPQIYYLSSYSRNILSDGFLWKASSNPEI